MIMAKNLCERRKSQACGGRSRHSKLIRQSSSSAQSSSTGPARNAFSSSDSVAGGRASSAFQSGLPEKSSASHHTSPASIASRSVVERLGSARWPHRKSGLEIQSRRNDVLLIDFLVTWNTKPASAITVPRASVHGCSQAAELAHEHDPLRASRLQCSHFEDRV